VVVHGSTVAGRGIQLQLSRIAADHVKFFGRPAAADSGRDPGAELAHRVWRQSHQSALYGQDRRPRDPIGPGDGQEPQLTIGLFHAQGVAAVARDDLDSLAAERMDGQPDRCHRPAREHGRPGARRRPRPGFGSALGLSLSGASGVG
jgi:hypothetical protein